MLIFILVSATNEWRDLRRVAPFLCAVLAPQTLGLFPPIKTLGSEPTALGPLHFWPFWGLTAASETPINACTRYFTFTLTDQIGDRDTWLYWSLLLITLKFLGISKYILTISLKTSPCDFFGLVLNIKIRVFQSRRFCRAAACAGWPRASGAGALSSSFVSQKRNCPDLHHCSIQGTAHRASHRFLSVINWWMT